MRFDEVMDLVESMDNGDRVIATNDPLARVDAENDEDGAPVFVLTISGAWTEYTETGPLVDAMLEYSEHWERE